MPAAPLRVATDSRHGCRGEPEGRRQHRCHERESRPSATAVPGSAAARRDRSTSGVRPMIESRRPPCCSTPGQRDREQGEAHARPAPSRRTLRRGSDDRVSTVAQVPSRSSARQVAADARSVTAGTPAPPAEPSTTSGATKPRTAVHGAPGAACRSAGCWQRASPRANADGLATRAASAGGACAWARQLANAPRPPPRTPRRHHAHRHGMRGCRPSTAAADARHARCACATKPGELEEQRLQRPVAGGGGARSLPAQSMIYASSAVWPASFRPARRPAARTLRPRSPARRVGGMVVAGVQEVEGRRCAHPAVLRALRSPRGRD